MTYTGTFIRDIERTVEQHLVDERYSLIEEVLAGWYEDAWVYFSYRAQRKAWPNRPWQEWGKSFDNVEDLELRYQQELAAKKGMA